MVVPTPVATLIDGAAVIGGAWTVVPIIFTAIGSVLVLRVGWIMATRLARTVLGFFKR